MYAYPICLFKREGIEREREKEREQERELEKEREGEFTYARVLSSHIEPGVGTSNVFAYECVCVC